MRVSAESRADQDRRPLADVSRFRADAIETIGEGTHERVVVTLERFDQRVQKKAAQILRGSSD